MKSRILVSVPVVLFVIALAGCGEDSEPAAVTTQTATVEPTDAEVILPDEPAEGFVLGDPSFKALPGAQAFFGQLGGTVYQIEMPDAWNGRLVLLPRGFHFLDAELTTVLDDLPPFAREFLVDHGYAWASSSYSTDGIVRFQGAHETAALHEFFIQEFGQPTHTYMVGGSMGGAATLLSLELFPSRYDGALTFCSAMRLPEGDFFGHYLVLGAYAARVTQTEFDSRESFAQLVERILSVLDGDSDARALFESLVAALTGGPRPFRHEGFEEYYLSTFDVLAQVPRDGPGFFDNTDFVYPVVPMSGVSVQDLNNAVVRIAADPQVRNVDPNFSNRTGAIPIPLLMIHTTGDGFNPISLQYEFQLLAEAAGNRDLLVQRAIRTPGHCTDLSEQEQETTLQALA